MQAFRRALDHETELREEIKAIDTGKIGTVNTRLADARLDIKAIERSYDIREENGTRTAALQTESRRQRCGPPCGRTGQTQ